MASLVGLVTPADVLSPSYTAFEDELCNRFGWPKSTLQCYPINNFASVDAAAKKAHDDVKANGGVLVAAGEMAAFFLQDKTPPTDKIPIILAYGGETPSNADKNMTGFTGSCVTVGLHHLEQMKGHNVTVLFDPDQNNRATQHVLTALKNHPASTITPLPIAPDKIGMLAAKDLKTDAFMIIPNAVYYEKADVIAGAVEAANHVQIAYYPEVEYWRKHKKKSVAKVFGHNVPLTYRLAASWVDNLLKGFWTVDTLPKFADAITENYE
jgi:hypothetical protein